MPPFDLAHSLQAEIERGLVEDYGWRYSVRRHGQDWPRIDAPEPDFEARRSPSTEPEEEVSDSENSTPTNPWDKNASLLTNPIEVSIEHIIEFHESSSLHTLYVRGVDFTSADITSLFKERLHLDAFGNRMYHIIMMRDPDDNHSDTCLKRMTEARTRAVQNLWEEYFRSGTADILEVEFVVISGLVSEQREVVDGKLNIPGILSGLS